MKAVILCAGEGTRLRPLTWAQPKALLPVANKPLIAYAIESLRAAGCREIGVVSSPGQRAAMAALGDGARWQVRLTHLTQTGPKGIAAAMLAAREFLGDDPFAVYLGDNLLEGTLAPAMARFGRGDAAALLLLKEVADPRAFGVALLDGERVTQVVEKPADPLSNSAICGVYLFSPAVWDAIAGLAPSARGELEITDAIAALIGGGHLVVGQPLEGWWHDIGTLAGYLAANRDLLARLPAGRGRGVTVLNSRLEGPVSLGAGAVVERSVVIGPCAIGPGCVLRDARVGPYASLGAGTHVEGATVAESVVLAGARIAHVPWPLTGTVVGPDAVLMGGPGAPGRGRE